jgi:hypothetical protein
MLTIFFCFISLAAQFPVWSENSTGMHQFVVWTALATEGMGASLQVRCRKLFTNRPNNPVALRYIFHSISVRTLRKLRKTY